MQSCGSGERSGCRAGVARAPAFYALAPCSGQGGVVRTAHTGLNWSQFSIEFLRRRSGVVARDRPRRDRGTGCPQAIDPRAFRQYPPGIRHQAIGPQAIGMLRVSKLTDYGTIIMGELATAPGTVSYTHLTLPTIYSV